jgi:flagellin
MTFHVGEENSDTFAVSFDNSNKSNIGEDSTDVNAVASSWSSLTQAEATAGITTLDTAIKSMAKTIQSMGDYQARLSSKEESLSLGISNTEATRSRIEDADFAKEQMTMMKLQILQQTSVSAFTQSNSAPQVVLSLFR